jgi:hypothetical protein
MNKNSLKSYRVYDTFLILKIEIETNANDLTFFRKKILQKFSFIDHNDVRVHLTGFIMFIIISNLFFLLFFILSMLHIYAHHLFRILFPIST